MDALKYDKPLDVLVGNSRKAKVWKNQTLRWSELLERLQTPTRTAETVAEYRAMSRERQSDIKDVGGFVGGYCTDGRRTEVVYRTVLCLDADYADGDLWPDWGLAYGCAAAVYSTHKHTPEKPRLRLVIPLSRDVTPDEYQAIGRRVAATLGMDKFDDTTYQPKRVMYWPSCSRDGEYIYDHVDGPLLDADQVLATYHDWRDATSWPMSSREPEVVKRSAAKQGDPLEKGGIVGAFCRAYYPIQEAIAAYVPTYQPCDEPGRYTYTEGSSGAGVVIYDDKYTYSHHSTDPVSGQTCNAWDLVRVHLYGALDADADPTKPVTSRPSYKAMTKLATEDERVRAQLVHDRMSEAVEDFASQVEDTPEEADWRGKLKVTEKGTVAMTIENVAIILRHDPTLKDALALNEMDHTIQTRRALPWRKDAGQWTDADDAALRYYLERTYGLSGKDKIFDAVNVVAGENAYHPVREYLDGCTWDGVPRVETLLVDYLGADDSRYTRAVTRKTLAAAVARIYKPGCKFDYMLTLQGRQGLGKSALIGRLGGPWYSDTFGTMQGKEAYEQVLGVWLVEVGELAGMKRAEAETIKLFISKQADRFRPAYGRRMQEYPRQCIFVGTTNEPTFLRDATGNRRFWVVATPNDPAHSWTELTPDVVRQVWAEAVEIYHKGETLFLPPEIEAEAREVQAAYEEENPRAGIVAEYLDRLLPDGWEKLDPYMRRSWLETDSVGVHRRTTVSTMEIWAEALGGNPDKLDRYAVKEIRDIMTTLPEWRNRGSKRITCKPYGRQRYYERSDGNG